VEKLELSYYSLQNRPMAPITNYYLFICSHFYLFNKYGIRDEHIQTKLSIYCSLFTKLFSKNNRHLLFQIKNSTLTFLMISKTSQYLRTQYSLNLSFENYSQIHLYINLYINFIRGLKSLILWKKYLFFLKVKSN